MKIEIGESLIITWLRHVKRCQVVQNNWKISTKWNNYNVEDTKVLWERVAEVYPRVFVNTTLEKALKQGELDVLGVAFEDATNDDALYTDETFCPIKKKQNTFKMKVYAVEIANHKDGLNYNKNSAETVMKKMIRAALSMVMYMSLFEGEIIFVSPKIGDKDLEKINVLLKDIEKVFPKAMYNFKFVVVSGERFKEEILKPVIDIAEDINDDNELFLRSVQLLRDTKMF